MKERNKGFTLIELLAVIVILAIIALIAVPIVMNLITKARLSAAKDSAYGVLKSAQNYYAEKLIDTQGAGFEDVTFECKGGECFYQGEEKETLKINGTIPTSGKIAVTSTLGAKLTTPLVINGYYCDYVDEAETAIDCSTTMKDLTNSSEITEEERMLKIYPVGSIYVSINDTNPSELFGGTWEAYSQGRTLIGAGTGTDTNNTQKTFSVTETGGEYSHTLTTNEIPSHKEVMNYVYNNTAYSSQIVQVQYGSGDDTFSTNATSGTTGGNQSHNNIQPYVTVYMWLRTE